MAVVDLLKPTSGTWRVVGSRWLLYMLAILPGTMTLSRHLDETVGKHPWFQDLQMPLEYLPTKFVLAELGGGVAILAAGVALIWVLQLVWLGGSIQILDPNRPDIRSKVFSQGWQFLARFIRIAIFAVIATLLLQWLVSKVFGSLSARAEIEAWPVYSSYITLNLWKATVIFILLTLVGVVAFWMRVIAASEDRRDTRRLPWQAVKILLHRPGAALLLQFLLVCAVLGIQAMALWCWRQSSAGVIWVPVWAALQLLTAYVWQLRIRSSLNVIRQIG